MFFSLHPAHLSTHQYLTSFLVILSLQSIHITTKSFSDLYVRPAYTQLVSIIALVVAFLALSSLHYLALDLSSSPLQLTLLSPSHRSPQDNVLVRVGGAFSILSSSFGLGIYSFIMYDFNPYRFDRRS